MGDLSCENELEELMHQIDVMVNSKKVEWQKEVLVLEQTLEDRERELTEARSALGQKDCEIGILSKKLEQADESKFEIVQNSEKELESLKTQLCQLKKNYEKLHYYHVQSQKSDSIVVPVDHAWSQSELRWLSLKLEENKGQAKQWEKQRTLYQNHLKTLNEQRKTLAEKCDFLQKQSQSYQEQLRSRTQLQDAAVTSNQSEIRRLRFQLEASQDTLSSDELVMESLKCTVKEITLSRDSLKAENQRLLQELRNCQKRCQRMESELSEATIELQARDDLLRAVELDQRQIHKDMNLYQNSQGNKLSCPESDLYTQKPTSNKEQIQKWVRRSPCDSQAEKHPCNKEEKIPGLETLRADISDLTAKLNQKDVTIATISEKVSRLERELEGREQETVHRQVLKSAAEMIPSDSCTAPPEQERLGKYCSSVQNIQPEEPERMKAEPWQRHATRAQSLQEQHRSFNEETQNKILNNNTSNNLTFLSEFDGCGSGWDTPAGSLLVNQEFLEAIAQNGCQFPEMDLTDFSLVFVSDRQNESTTAPDQEGSFISAAERFLWEENQRAGDFEKILNSHIEELHRNCERTVSKYTSHSRYIASS
ncbi:deuterosome assembly protein 1 [Pseudophryne corroboree]|uniref:deuterosome assembly protein 1 n=1 Tax=Pseudophryne corroboree TaxID=495146 RepID=UPI00308199F4